MPHRKPAADWIYPDWPAPACVKAVCTTRNGGVSDGPYCSMNLGDHVGDDPAMVRTNRERLRQALLLPGEPVWLHQVHGTAIVDAACTATAAEADGSYARTAGVVCAVMTADCLPVLLTDRSGTAVAAMHAGWRGLVSGVIEAAVAAMQPAAPLLAWLGPAIGPEAFEVGDEVREAFIVGEAQAAGAFRPSRGGRWLADIYSLARQRLMRAGVSEVFGGGLCTYNDPLRYFSYRRDGVSGRMATLIWIEG